MKKILNIIILNIIILLMVPLCLFAQQDGFTIDGHLDGLKDGETVKLGDRFKDWHTRVTIDSCLVKDGKFHLSTTFVPDGPRFYEIAFYGHEHTVAGKRIGGKVINVFLDNGDRVVIQGGDINQ